MTVDVTENMRDRFQRQRKLEREGEIGEREGGWERERRETGESFTQTDRPWDGYGEVMA